MGNEDLSERVAKLEVTVDKHEQKWNSQIDKNESLTRLTTLMEMQMEESKQREKRQIERDNKQNEQMDKFAATLSRVDENLTNLNTNQERLNQNQQKLGERVSDIEDTLQEGKININKLIKDIIFKVVPALVLAYLLFKLGL